MSPASPWDIPPSDTGDPIPDPIYTSVGKALSAWEELEVEISCLFAVLIGLRRRSPEAYAAYAAGVGFSGRSTIVEKASEPFFIKHPNQTDEGDFTSMLIRLRGYSLRRNDIAHGVVRLLSRISIALGTGGTRITSSYFLVPANYMRKRFLASETPRYHYSSNMIDSFQATFKNLNESVAKLIDRLSRKRRS